jgi:predicted transcriptional regulator
LNAKRIQKEIPMKALTIRNVDEQVYHRLQEMARMNRRSLQAQIKLILEREVQLTQGSHTHKIQEWRQRLADRPWGNIVSDIRRERER